VSSFQPRAAAYVANGAGERVSVSDDGLLGYWSGRAGECRLKLRSPLRSRLLGFQRRDPWADGFLNATVNLCATFGAGREQ
jgi:hypothetical protein